MKEQVVKEWCERGKHDLNSVSSMPYNSLLERGNNRNATSSRRSHKQNKARNKLK
ncbi:hypothetical protein KAU13_03635 [candidate division WOR-3 bacterium]|nr:hypothetical protein [candidate division WOR-3 bacterium]